jgi:hypothetical protein
METWYSDCKVTIVCSEPSSLTSRSPSIDLPLPLRRSETNLSLLRTNGLAPTSTYWTYWSRAGDMGPVSLVAGHHQKVRFAPTASLVGSGEKLGMDPWINQPSCCRLYWEPFFSGVVAQLRERLLYLDRVRYIWLTAIHLPSLESISRSGFGKTAITFWYELKIKKKLKVGRKFCCIHFTLPRAGFRKFRLPKFSF